MGSRFSWVKVVVGCVCLGGVQPVAAAQMERVQPAFRFASDTLAFANETVFVYPHGHAEARKAVPGGEAPTFTLRCFAMCRSVEQFWKFARFDATLPAPDDAALAALVRKVTRHAVWRNPLPPDQRVVIPGYANLHDLSAARRRVLQRSVGAGWTTYLRPGNYRMLAFWWNGPWEQAWTRRTLDETLAHGDLFVGYLTTYPSLSINHAVLLYGRQPVSPADAGAGLVRYAVYDPNHPEAPREMVYDTRRRQFSYQKDWDFVGGKVTVLQVYGRWLQ